LIDFYYEELRSRYAVSLPSGRITVPIHIFHNSRLPSPRDRPRRSMCSEMDSALSPWWSVFPWIDLSRSCLHSLSMGLSISQS